jgi:hypothetical protein
MQILGAAALLTMTSACAPLSEAERDEREYRQVDFVEQFLVFREDCTGRGKRILIDAMSRVSRDGIPSPGDRYFCG